MSRQMAKIKRLWSQAEKFRAHEDDEYYSQESVRKLAEAVKKNKEELAAIEREIQDLLKVIALIPDDREAKRIISTQLMPLENRRAYLSVFADIKE